MRYSEIDLDDDTFEGAAGVRFANASSTTDKAKSWAGGVNWYLNKNIKLQTTYEQTRFSSGVDGVDDREDEKVLFSRFQVAF